MQIRTLGEPRFNSPFDRAVGDLARIPTHIVRETGAPHTDELLFERAGPPARIFFDPQHARAGIAAVYVRG